MVKFEDGKEEEHKVLKTKDKAEIKNLTDWICPSASSVSGRDLPDFPAQR
jgi:hypothetical protein